MRPAAFWALTLPEFHALARGYQARQEQLGQSAVMQAWYVAALSRQKRLPSLRALMHPPVTRRLTPDEKAERQAELVQLTARMITPGDPGRKES